MAITQLKGGSLNSTCLHDDGTSKFIRKSINTHANREYGYVRWYSQLKKLQRYDTLFPRLVPKVLDVGIDNDSAYFDIEFVSGKDVKTLFVNNEIDDVNELSTRLFMAFDTIHSIEYKHNPSSLKLYFREEVLQKLNDALSFVEFKEFYNLDTFNYNGESVLGIKSLLQRFEKLFDTSITVESCVHGNPTLENIMYDPVTKKITFIDLYEEGIVDSKFMDYSQILQCSSSFYGIHNDNPVTVDGINVSSDAAIPTKLIEFNAVFNEELKKRYSESEIQLIKLFEATQFFRMLPFKCHAGNFDQAKFFYVHACYLVNNLL
jgi:hypothetical protein